MTTLEEPPAMTAAAGSAEAPQASPAARAARSDRPPLATRNL